MTPHDLIAAFETLAEAEDGVKRLRELVLQLAVRGKLVAQDPADEPAAALLDHRVTYPEEPPYPLPPGWAWSSLACLGSSLGGGTPSKSKPHLWDGPIPWVSPKDMKVDFIDDAQDHLSPAALSESAARLIPIGSVLMVVRGMILAHSFPVAVTRVDLTINQDMKAVVPFRSDLAPFLLKLLKGSRDRVLAMVERSTHGTCKLAFDAVAGMCVAVPPLAEQHRIVARVDELMGLLDRLEAARTAREEVRRAARDAALAALREAEDAEAVEAAWRRVVSEMGTLFRRAEDVGALRKVVLQLAVRGRLVPQDSVEKPATRALSTALSDRTWREDERERPAKPDASIEAMVGTRRLPSGWVECRLNDVAQLINGRAYSQPELLTSGTPVIRIQNLNGGDRWYYSDLELPERQYCTNGDLLFAWSASFGPYIWSGSKAIYHYHIWKLQLSDALDRRFAFYLLGDLTQAVKANSHGLAMLHMTKSKMEAWPVLLPPVAEQHRIVAKVDQLMALCDDLEAKLVHAAETQRTFAGAAVHHLDA